MKRSGVRYGIAPKPGSYSQREMMQNINIPQPCAENWNEMQSNGQGRRCVACVTCVTTVKDFTAWAPEEIAAYLNANAEAIVCGRFRAWQLNNCTNSLNYPAIAQSIHTAALSFTNKIALIILVVIGISASSCISETLGKPVLNDHKKSERGKCNTDSMVLMGEILTKVRR